MGIRQTHRQTDNERRRMGAGKSGRSETQRQDDLIGRGEKRGGHREETEPTGVSTDWFDNQ